MDRQKIVLWVAVIGLATALLAFGTQSVSLMKELKTEQQARREDRAQLKDLLQEVREAQKQRDADRVELEQKYNQRLMEQQQFMNERRAVCDQHYALLQQDEQMFSRLTATHGTMIRSMSRCMSSKDAGAGLLCAGIVCSFGGQQCVDAVVRADQLKSSIKRTQSTAISDGCTPPTSPALEFYRR